MQLAEIILLPDSKVRIAEIRKILQEDRLDQKNECWETLLEETIFARREHDLLINLLEKGVYCGAEVKTRLVEAAYKEKLLPVVIALLDHSNGPDRLKFYSGKMLAIALRNDKCDSYLIVRCLKIPKIC